MVRLDGKVVAAKCREEIAQKVEFFAVTHGRKPGLAVVLVGDDPASHVYVSAKEKACHQVGLNSFRYDLPATISQSELDQKICELNERDDIDGILVQLPLPKGLESHPVLERIHAEKDVDGLGYESGGLLWAGRPRAVPCTPKGVIRILKHYRIPIEGKKAVVIGRSHMVGKPMAALLLEENATVTIAHSRTQEMDAVAQQADILVVAAGKPHLIGRDQVKEGAVVIDVGVHRLEGKKLCGDVKYAELEGWASAATPVPGGVGPMTIAMLLENTLELAKNRMNP